MSISKFARQFLPFEDMDMQRWDNRATGKSTGLAHKFISEAILSPEKPVRIHDHYGTKHSDGFLFLKIRDICYELGLDWMEFNRGGLTITYKPFMELKRTTKVIWEEK